MYTATAQYESSTASSVAMPSSNVGFTMPVALPTLPDLKGDCNVLSLQDEVAVGFRLQMLTLRMLGAMAADTVVVERLVKSVLDALGTCGNPERAVTMIKLDGSWVRVGSIPNEGFAAHVRRKVDVILTRIAELRAVSSTQLEDDLFSHTARQHLKEAVCEVVPYDYLINRASEEFKERCEDLNQRCRALVRFLAAELRISPRAAHRIVCGHWASPALFSSITQAAGYEFSLYPRKARKQFRDSVIEHQRAIVSAVESADVPVVEMLEAWDTYWASNRSLDQTMEFFARANKGLVEKAVREYRFADTDQVRSAAQLGLVRAIQRYAPELGWKFSTYATTWIRQCILRDLEQQNMIRLPEGAHASVVKLGNVLRENPRASYESMAAATSLKVDEVKNLIPFVNNRKSLSLDSGFSAPGEEDEGWHEQIPDENNNFADEVADNNAAAYLLKVLSDVLSERELEVIVNRYGLNGSEPCLLSEVAVLIDRTVERVRQIEKAAIAKILASGHAETLKELF